MQPFFESLRWLERVFKLEATRLRTMQRLWLQIYEYYGEQISDDQLLWYAQDMEGYTPEQVAGALLTWRRSPPPPGHKPRAPRPQEVLAMLGPQQTLDGIATLLANRIWDGTGTFGRMGSDRAYAHFGANNTEIIKAMGGWGKMVQNADGSRRDNFVPQTRDFIKAVLAERNETPVQRQLAANTAQAAEMLGEAPQRQALPGRNGKQGKLEGIGETLDKLVPHD